MNDSGAKAAEQMSVEELSEQLSQEVGECYFSDLEAHIKRGAVLQVSSDLQLLDVAVAVASDDAVSVQEWIGDAKLTSPSSEAVSEWQSNPDAQFRVVIVRPYVLVQPLGSA
jgi:hypothetical protein